MKMKLFVIALVTATIANCSSTFTGHLQDKNTNTETQKIEIYSDGAGASLVTDFLVLPFTIVSTEIFNKEPGPWLTGQHCSYIACTTVTICDKQTHTCQKIDHIMISTEMAGIHIFDSALSSKMKKLLYSERYIQHYTDLDNKPEIRTINECVATPVNGAIDGYVTPGTIKAGSYITDTNLHIVTKYGNDTQCPQNYVDGEFVHIKTDKTIPGFRKYDPGFGKFKETGINGILGLGINDNTNIEQTYDGSLYTQQTEKEFQLVKHLKGTENYIIKVPKAGEKGYIKFINNNRDKLTPTHKHYWTFDTGIIDTYGNNEKVHKRNLELYKESKGTGVCNGDPLEAMEATGQIDIPGGELRSEYNCTSTPWYIPLPLYTKAYGDLAGKTLTFITVNGQRYVKVGNDVYKSNY